MCLGELHLQRWSSREGFAADQGALNLAALNCGGEVREGKGGGGAGGHANASQSPLPTWQEQEHNAGREEGCETFAKLKGRMAI